MTISRDQLLDLARRAGFSPTGWQLDPLDDVKTAPRPASLTRKD